MSTYKKVAMENAPESFENCPPFLERYLDYLGTFQGRKPATVIEAVVNLTEFFQYIYYKEKNQESPREKDAHKDMDISKMELATVCKVTDQDIEEFLCFLDVVVRNAISTIRKKLTNIRRFFIYLERNADEFGLQLVNGNPAKELTVAASTSKKQSGLLKPEQIRRLADSTTGEHKLRDTAMILVLATTGITLSELVSLNVGDLDDDTLVIRKGAKKERDVYMTAECALALNKYIRSKESDNNECPMFTGIGNNRRMTAAGIHKRIVRAAKTAGLGSMNITACRLRDYAACNLLQKTKHPAEKEQILAYLGCNSKLSGRRYEEVMRNA